MRSILALALLAIFGFAVAGCGATKKVVLHVDTGLATKVTRTVTVSGSTTISTTAKTGTVLTCKGLGVVVVPGGVSIAGKGQSETIVSPTHPRTGMTFTRESNGSIRVTCKRP